MKITLNIYNKNYSVESDDDSTDVHTMAEHFKGLLVSAGYHPCNVDSIINTDYQWFTDEEIAENLQGHKNRREEDIKQAMKQIRESIPKDETPF
jgi:Tat protein secretion system quality control protein TatD with DNase activity